jgi:predicted ribosome quality control (RQC) complex YloA/Tae2 family protein
MLQHAISTLTRRRFPGTGEEVSRWTVRRSALPAGTDAWVLLSVEELAVNDLRETFHHWVRTLILPVSRGQLGAPLPHTSALDLRDAQPTRDEAHHAAARAIVDDVEPELKARISKHAASLTQSLQTQLAEIGKAARDEEEQRYRSRQAEISSLIQENTLAKLEREIDKLKAERNQGMLFDEAQRLDEIDRSIEEKRAEIERRTRHYTEVKEQLDRERERILKSLLPKRHAMSGPAQVFPVSIEVRLPGGAR